MGTCGQIFENEHGEMCACTIETPPPSRAEQSQRMTMVYPFPCRHDGPHIGPRVDDDSENPTLFTQPS
jgi:hypothetical protein